MTPTAEALRKWLDLVSGAGWVWYVKYLAANDTYAKPNVHQGGPYVGKEVLRTVFPVLTERALHEVNPDLFIPVQLDSHNYLNDIRLVWYNSRIVERRANGRDEARLTQWGGRGVALLEPEATGSLVLFAYHQPDQDADAEGCRIWICESAAEEELVFERVGPVEPGVGALHSPTGTLAFAIAPSSDRACALTPEEVPLDWRTTFPSGQAIVARTVDFLPVAARLLPDARLLKRRDCEYEMFRSLETLHVLPRIKDGFATVDLFVEFAHSVTNRRKSRSGKSLELHAKAIFDEEGVPYSWAGSTEAKRTPDFIFPSIERYHDEAWDRRKLRMLAAKTTCKDRWRQITTEAAEIPLKHLLTLQEGVSAHQFAEMKEEGVVLVVPQPLHEQYPEEIRSDLMTLAAFITEAKALVD